LAVALAVSSGGCVEMGLKRVSAVAAAESATQVGCVLQKSRNLQALASQVKLAPEARAATDLCTSPAHYVCTHRQFSPDALSEKTTREECTELPSLGGKVCLSLASQIFNTREAARTADLGEQAIEPGGELNRHEYLCHHVQLKDGDTALVQGEADTFAEALRRVSAKCTGVSSFLLTERL
jgi:hypothetical protein